jgi:hypothetical protein
MTQTLKDPNLDASAVEVSGQTAGIAFSVADGQAFESISAARRTPHARPSYNQRQRTHSGRRIGAAPSRTWIRT